MHAQYACVLEDSVPQGELQTLAIKHKRIASWWWRGSGGVPHQFLASFRD